MVENQINEFHNDQILSSQIPDIANINYEKLDPNHLKAEVLTFSIIFGIISIIGLTVLFVAANNNLLFWGVLLGDIFFATAIYLFIIKAHKQKGYAIREKDILYKEGLLFKSETIIPFNRVQHVEVNQGAIDRMFGLAGLGIFTAGGSASDLTIPGLTPYQAHKIKDFLIRITGHDEEE